MQRPENRSEHLKNHRRSEKLSAKPSKIWKIITKSMSNPENRWNKIWKIIDWKSTKQDLKIDWKSTKQNLKMDENRWTIVKIDENRRTKSENLWKSMNNPENLWKSIHNPANQWKSMKTYENRWTILKTYEKYEQSWTIWKSTNLNTPNNPENQWEIHQNRWNYWKSMRNTWKPMRKIGKSMRIYTKIDSDTWKSLKMIENAWNYLWQHIEISWKTNWNS